jgi:hypothetical protein
VYETIKFMVAEPVMVDRAGGGAQGLENIIFALNEGRDGTIWTGTRDARPRNRADADAGKEGIL